jgi:hypothetical protein
MSDPFSAGSAASTSASNEPDTTSSGSASPTGGDGPCSPHGSPEPPATTTFETFRQNMEGEVFASPPVLRAKATGANQPMLLISSAEDSPARTSPSPDDEPDSTETEAPSSSSSHGSQISLFQPEGMCSLRTFPDFFPPTVDAISPSYWRRWPSSGFTTSPGECWTADTSECPSGAAASSSLADVLEETVAPRYFLSPKAAAGILRRAETRGRSLPSHLYRALETVARTTTTDRQDG